MSQRSKNVLILNKESSKVSTDIKFPHLSKTDYSARSLSDLQDKTKPVRMLRIENEKNELIDDYRGKTFPQKLFHIISDERNTNIINWLPEGNAFMILDKKRFAKEILFVYFKQTQFTSFTRKLNRWSFNRVARGPLIGAYYHTYFRRDKPSLSIYMCCINGHPKFPEHDSSSFGNKKQEHSSSIIRDGHSSLSVDRLNIEQNLLLQLHEKKRSDTLELKLCNKQEIFEKQNFEQNQRLMLLANAQMRESLTAPYHRDQAHTTFAHPQANLRSLLKAYPEISNSTGYTNSLTRNVSTLMPSSYMNHDPNIIQSVRHTLNQSQLMAHENSISTLTPSALNGRFTRDFTESNIQFNPCLREMFLRRMNSSFNSTVP